MLRVQIGTLQFLGQDDSSDSLLLIEPDGFTGWDEGTNVRREDIPRPEAHGSFDVPGYLTPRVVSISGELFTPTPLAFQHMRARLTGLLADGNTGRVMVEQDSGTQWADVRLGAQTQVRVNNSDLTSGRYQVQLWAPNPRKYGETRKFGPAMSVPAHHFGNFPASPVLEVSGFNASGGYTINGPSGKQYIVTQGLFGGDTHRIDMRTGVLYLNGVVQLGAVSRADLWTIPPGIPATQTLVPVSGAANITLRVNVIDTYI